MMTYLNRPKNTDNLPFGFVKFGIVQDNNSFIRAFSKCIQVNESKIFEDIQNMSINDYQRLGKLINYFKKDYVNISNNEVESFCIWFNKSNNILTKKYKISNYKNINDIIIYFNKIEYGIYLSYVFDLYISWNNYKDFIESNEYKDDHYVLPLLEILYNKNIIVLEHIFNDLKLKIPLNIFK